MNELILCRVEVIQRTHRAVLIDGEIVGDSYTGTKFKDWFPLSVCDSGGAEPWDPQRGDTEEVYIPERFLEEKGILNEA